MTKGIDSVNNFLTDYLDHMMETRERSLFMEVGETPYYLHEERLFWVQEDGLNQDFTEDELLEDLSALGIDFATGTYTDFQYASEVPGLGTGNFLFYMDEGSEFCIMIKRVDGNAEYHDLALEFLDDPSFRRV